MLLDALSRNLLPKRISIAADVRTVSDQQGLQYRPLDVFISIEVFLVNLSLESIVETS